MNRRTVAKYISESIIGMIGISVYILADTFFISKGFGSDGLAVLNMTLPLYGLVYAIHDVDLRDAPVREKERSALSYPASYSAGSRQDLFPRHVGLCRRDLERHYVSRL